MGTFPFAPTIAGVTGGGTGVGTAGGQIPWLPVDNNLLAAVGDPAEESGVALLSAGTLYLMKLPIRTATTITNVWASLTTAGSGASTGSFVGVYSSAGVLLSGSADIAASLTGSTGGISNPLTTPQAIAAGSFVWLAILVNLAVTQPTLARSGSSSGSLNLDETPALLRACTNGTLLSALPGTIVPGSNSSTPNLLLMAVN
jgi:hypothetical protein